MQELLNAARKNCSSTEDDKQYSNLFTRVVPVFSAGQEGVELTKLIEHSILVVSRARPICWLLHKMAPKM